MSVSAASLEAYWLPFTANRDFKKKPRVIVGAEGHWYVADDGRRLSLPFTRRTVPRIDLAQRRLVIEPPEEVILEAAP